MHFQGFSWEHSENLYQFVIQKDSRVLLNIIFKFKGFKGFSEIRANPGWARKMTRIQPIRQLQHSRLRRPQNHVVPRVLPRQTSPRTASSRRSSYGRSNWGDCPGPWPRSLAEGSLDKIKVSRSCVTFRIIKKGKGSFYIAQYPICLTAQIALHFLPSLTDLFIPTPTRLLREAF